MIRPTAEPPMEVAIIGAGVGGLGAAWLCGRDSRTRVTIYDARSQLGGHANTVTVRSYAGRQPFGACDAWAHVALMLLGVVMPPRPTGAYDFTSPQPIRRASRSMACPSTPASLCTMKTRTPT
jgi:monoamine oxidase